MSSAEVTHQIEQALDSIRPYLEADGGNVELVEINDNWDVVLRLTGACSSCSMSEMTMTAGIEETLRRAIPQLKNIKALRN